MHIAQKKLFVIEGLSLVGFITSIAGFSYFLHSPNSWQYVALRAFFAVGFILSIVHLFKLFRYQNTNTTITLEDKTLCVEKQCYSLEGVDVVFDISQWYGYKVVSVFLVSKEHKTVLLDKALLSSKELQELQTLLADFSTNLPLYQEEKKILFDVTPEYIILENRIIPFDAIKVFDYEYVTSSNGRSYDVKIHLKNGEFLFKGIFGGSEMFAKIYCAYYIFHYGIESCVIPKIESNLTRSKIILFFMGCAFLGGIASGIYIVSVIAFVVAFYVFEALDEAEHKKKLAKQIEKVYENLTQEIRTRNYTRD